ncbi:MAG: hypothetical protein GPJ54_05510 [Candidatus Heimdallarchaeota archaeon]|nr:hypothetical protein [Candidatus Heimdallarchaeota archaeon]
MTRLIRYLPEVLVEKSGGPLIVSLSYILSLKIEANDSDISYAKMELKAPWGLSSGWADSFTKMKAVSRLGAGLVISKTITYNSRKGNPRPRIIRLQNGMINSMGLPNKGLAAWVSELKRAKTIPTHYIFSVKGDNIEEWNALISNISVFTNNIELNFSCPNVENGVMDLKNTERMLSSIRKINHKVNLFLKLSPQYSDNELLNLIRIIHEKKLVNGISLFNTIPTQHDHLGNPNKIGGYSGPLLYNRLTNILTKIRSNSDLTNLPILAMGGISSLQQAKEIWGKYNALPLIFTAFLQQGPLIFKNWGRYNKIM